MQNIMAMFKSVIPLFFIITMSAHANTNYTFFVTDNNDQALADVVIEPDVADTSTPPVEVAVIDQVDKRFKPSQILIDKGQRVAFPNSDNIRHHVYSFSQAKTFELKLYADTPESPIQFPDHGVVVLGCNIHDTMIGYIFVSKSSNSVMTATNGETTLQTTQDIERVNVWHAHHAAGPENLLSVDLKSLKRDPAGRYLINMDIIPPAPTNSFEDTFGGLSKEY
ncbi:methylamine utilization protein [Methylophaga sp.]|uniref:methylamine utilization protein n=1 Tax=Methylophaga sp. TaxID=2024840 RepID=UPI003F69D445